MRPSARLIDANLNRAREALRVMEDAARFSLDHPALAADLKAARHALAAAATLLNQADLIAARDTPGDLGTAITAAGEYDRASLADVAAASAKRLTEALRAIEEAAKTDASTQPAAAPVEALRYRAYDLERRLTLAFRDRSSARWRCCLLLTRAACAKPWRDVLTAALDGGVDCVQVREKQTTPRDLAAHTRAVIDIARPRGIPVIVNDRADVALAAGADGVHLGDDDTPADQLRAAIGDRLLIGVSTHRLEDAHAALDAGADYCGVGQTFPSDTKQRNELAGLDYVRAYFAWSQHSRVPGLAIGGITPDNIADVAQAGATGVAVSRAITTAPDPAQAAAAIVQALPAFE
ncbi:MAG: thiamine phosphate synthase [Planctomycetota bacterium]